jgi:hypothetical protein
MASLTPLLFMRMARTAISRSAPWMVPRESSRKARYRPFGFTLQDRTKMRSRDYNPDAEKQCWPVPAQMRRRLLSRRTSKVSPEN